MSDFRILIITEQPGENIPPSLVTDDRGEVMYFGSRDRAETVAARQPVRPFVTYVVEELR